MRAALLVVLVACGPPAVDGLAEPTYDDVAPILETHCVRCHLGPTPNNGGLGLSSYVEASSAAVRSTCTAVSQPVVDAHPEALTSLAYPDDPPCAHWLVLSMPPGPRLSPAEQDTLVRWVEAGTPR